MASQALIYLPNSNADTFGNFMDATFAPYFKPLKPCISELRNLVMDPAFEPTHEQFIKILRNYADSEEIRLADEAHAKAKGSNVTSNNNISQPDSENVEVSEDSDGDDCEEQGTEGEEEGLEPDTNEQDAGDEEDETGSDGQDAGGEEDELDSDEESTEENNAQDIGESEYDGDDIENAVPNLEGLSIADFGVAKRAAHEDWSDSASSLSSGRSTPDEPANTPHPNNATRESSATDDAEADVSVTAQGKSRCLCKEVAKAGAGKRVITCKDPQCEVVLYHCNCVNRGKKSKTPAKKWRCESCIKRGKQGPPEARRK